MAAALGRRQGAHPPQPRLLTVGHSIEEAAWWFIRMERCCEIQLLAEAAGTPFLIDDEAARQAFSEQGTHVAGWFTGHPLLDAVTADQPDLRS